MNLIKQVCAAIETNASPWVQNQNTNTPFHCKLDISKDHHLEFLLSAGEYGHFCCTTCGNESLIYRQQDTCPEYTRLDTNSQQNRCSSQLSRTSGNFQGIDMTNIFCTEKRQNSDKLLLQMQPARPSI